MTTIHTKDDIYLDIGDLPQDAPEVREAVQAERVGRRRRAMQTPEMQQKVAATRAQMSQELDPTAGMSATDKTLANVGAGLHSFGQGVKQLVGQGPSDEDVLETRRLDQQLSDKTDLGIGPEWAPTAGKLLQIGGEALPTMAIPMGPAAGVLAKVGSKVLPKALATAGRFLAKPVASGGVVGGISGLTTPTTSEESKLVNAGVGVASGMAFPLALGALGGGYRAIAPYLSRRAAQSEGARRAGEELAHAFPGQEAADLAQSYEARQAARAATTPGAQAIPESLSEATQSVPAAVLESRAARAPQNVGDWAAHERAQNAARWDALQSATREAEDLASRKVARKEGTEPLRAAAMDEAGDVARSKLMAPLKQTLSDIENSAEMVNPSVQTVVSLVKSAMNSRAPGGGQPESLHVVRKLLTKKLNGPAQLGDQLSSAVKGADAQTQALIKAIDASLENASGGQWQPYLDAFTEASQGVDASRSAKILRQSLAKEGVSRVGDVAQVTPTRLSTAMTAAKGSGKFDLALSPQAQKGVGDVMEQMLYSNEPQMVRKLAGTSGGGSHTETALADALAQHATSPLSGLGTRVVRVFQHALGSPAEKEAKRQLSQMLLDPERAFAAIRAAQAGGRELTPAQRALYTIMTRGTGAAGPITLQQPQ